MNRSLKVEAATQVVSTSSGTAIERVLQQYFLEDILPESGFFKPKNAPLYISSRCNPQLTKAESTIQSQLQVRSASGILLDNEYFENEMDQIFWGTNFSRYLYIVGDPGSGKSTFLDYYLRCFCPNAEIPPRDFTKK